MSDASSLFSALPNPPVQAAVGRAIALHARRQAGHDERVGNALQVLRAALMTHEGRIVQASSLGAEDMVITDLIARHGLAISVATLETGMLHAETLALIGDVTARYGLVIETWQPNTEATIQFVARNGSDAMYRSLELRKACCGIRKMEPLARLMAGRDAWVTGLRREQSSNRAAVEFVANDEHGRRKVSPLADWSWPDVWQYIADHDVPYNRLHDAFFPSIGCAPCTRAVAVGEDFRAGRWWWEDELAKECGLHATHEDPVVFPVTSPSPPPAGDHPTLQVSS